jgi:hypothetical protein
MYQCSESVSRSVPMFWVSRIRIRIRTEVSRITNNDQNVNEFFSHQHFLYGTSGVTWLKRRGWRRECCWIRRKNRPGDSRQAAGRQIRRTQPRTLRPCNEQALSVYTIYVTTPTEIILVLIVLFLLIIPPPLYFLTNVCLNLRLKMAKKSFSSKFQWCRLLTMTCQFSKKYSGGIQGKYDTFVHFKLRGVAFF